MFDLILDLVEDFHTVEERRLHRIFCGLGNQYADYRLGKLYLEGVDVPKDFSFVFAA